MSSLLLALSTFSPGGKVISKFGDPRPGGVTGRHQGVDIGAPTGSPIAATTDQTVTQVGVIGGKYGFGVKTIDAQGREHVYAHMSQDPRMSHGLRVGQKIGAGSPIGLVGQTGNARTTPPHLHYEVRPKPGAYTQSYDPARFLTGKGVKPPVAGAEAPKPGEAPVGYDRFLGRRKPEPEVTGETEKLRELEKPVKLNLKVDPGSTQFARTSMRHHAERELHEAKWNSYADTGAA